MNEANQLEIHYYLADGKHSLNAFILHRCDAEVLALLKEIASTCDFLLTVEAEALAEGGIKQKWKVLGKSAPQLTLILALFNLVLVHVPKRPTELESLQIADLKLSIQERQLRLDKLRYELAQHPDADVSKQTADEAAALLNSDRKITYHRSAFYQAAASEPRIQKITATRSQNNVPVGDPVSVTSSNFPDFIVSRTEVLPERKEGVLIEIISPVLKNGKYHWRGFYEGGPIDFQMRDRAFKEAVTRKEIVFKSGYTIECVLEIDRQLNEVGEVSSVRYSVLTVLARFEDGKYVQTEQGALHLAKKKNRENQYELFLPSKFSEPTGTESSDSAGSPGIEEPPLLENA